VVNRVRGRHALIGGLSWFVWACGSEPATTGEDPVIVLSDVTRDSGVSFVHDAGWSDARRLAETMSGGVAIFDADQDGLPEVLFTSLGAVGGMGGGVSVWHNLGGLRFVEVAGALASDRHAMGLAIGDVDGDGELDVLVTAIDGDELWLGGPGVSFAKAPAEQFEPPSPGFSASAALLQGPGNERLAMVVTRYVGWSSDEEPRCIDEGGRHRYCTPERFEAVPSRWLEAAGERGWRDLGERSPFADSPAKALGVVVLDANHDGRLDLAIANDTVPNQLFLAEEAGTFREDGAGAGFAVGAAGVARGGMGIAAAELFGQGREDLVVGNFSLEAAGVFRALGEGLFRDVAAEVGLGLATHLPLTFGVVTPDLDLDGAPEIVVANGHIEPSVADLSARREQWRQPLQVFRNVGGRFEALAPIGSFVGRGLATGDLDGDGDLDLVLAQNGAEPVILRNDVEGARSLRVRVVGPPGNRAGLGTLVRLTRQDGRVLVRRIEPSGSYLSASEPIATFGLGRSTAMLLELECPNEQRREVDDPPAFGTITVACEGG
jgi:hypothetical protein